MTTLAEQTTTTLAAPGAVLTYDIRGADADATTPVLLIIGSPMGASGFVTLASHFPDRTVVTYDPRGVDRSTKDDPSSPSTPNSTPTTCTGSSPSSARIRSTSSPAAAAP